MPPHNSMRTKTWSLEKGEFWLETMAKMAKRPRLVFGAYGELSLEPRLYVK